MVEVLTGRRQMSRDGGVLTLWDTCLGMVEVLTVRRQMSRDGGVLTSCGTCLGMIGTQCQGAHF